MRQLFLIGLAVAVSGCASGPPFTDAPPPDNGKALVYIYREANFAAAASGAAFFIDERKVVDLLAGGYSYIYLAPGHYEVEQRWSLFNYAPQAGEAVSIPLEVKAGDVRYVRFHSGVGAIPATIASPSSGRSSKCRRRWAAGRSQAKSSLCRTSPRSALIGCTARPTPAFSLPRF